MPSVPQGRASDHRVHDQPFTIAGTIFYDHPTPPTMLDVLYLLAIQISKLTVGSLAPKAGPCTHLNKLRPSPPVPLLPNHQSSAVHGASASYEASAVHGGDRGHGTRRSGGRLGQPRPRDWTPAEGTQLRKLKGKGMTNRQVAGQMPGKTESGVGRKWWAMRRRGNPSGGPPGPH